MSERDISISIAKNLVFYRKSAGYTQSQVAEVLSYSDKSISKWECGGSTPDIHVLTKLANLYGITIDDIINRSNQKPPLPQLKKILITCLATALVWLVAAVAYIFLQIFCPAFNWMIVYAFACPASAIVLIVFTSIWWNKWWTFAASSFLVWSVAFCISIFYLLPSLYVVVVILQIMLFMWFKLPFLKKSKKKKSKKEPLS